MFKREDRNYWKSRAEAAEAALTQCQAGLAIAQEHLAGIELRMNDRAALVSIVRQGRVNRFLFVRNGNTIMVETYSALEDDLPGWKRELLE